MGIDLSKFIFIDQHAHLLLRDFLQLDAIAFRQAFSETRSLGVLKNHVPTAAHYRHLLKRLGALTGARDEDGLLERRAVQRPQDYLALLWDDASIGGLIVDDGYRADDMLSLEQLVVACRRPVLRCLRIEPVLEQCLREANNFDELSECYGRALKQQGSCRTVALKTVAAYRGGLDLEIVSAMDARADFDRVKADICGGGRVERSALYHYFLLQAFEYAGEAHLPVQVHAGLGDDDADLRLSNPLCFREVLRSQAFSRTQFVFLHCYPFVRETSYLCSIYPNVYMDLSLAVSLVSAASDTIVGDALAAAPSSKILAGSDGHSVPEAHWYGAICWRHALETCLTSMVTSGFLREEEAYDSASLIMHGNARRLYALEELV